MRISLSTLRRQPVLWLLTLLVASVMGTAAMTVATGVEPPSDLFGHCPLFDSVVKEQMLTGQMTPEQAFAELDSHNCPIIRGASITNPQQLKSAVDQSLAASTHKDYPNSDNCVRLGELKQMVWDGSGEPKVMMDELVIINCPSLTSCGQFDKVKTQYASGDLTPSKAIQQLVQRCPLFSPPARAPTVVRAAMGTGTPPGKSMADECRRLSDMLYTVNDGQTASDTAERAQRAIDTLCENKVPIINNCPLFQSVKARYQSNQITAQEAVAEMKASCPILSKELNPAMIFNFEEYGMHRDLNYDVGDASHSHSHEDPKQCGAGCCCGADKADEASAKRLVKRHDAHKEPVCVGECSHDDHLARNAVPRVSGLERLLGGVFPKGNPALSSLLGTFYISLFPNLILFATPSSIPNKALRVMVGFAVGGLLGDVFLHLLPHMFSDEHDHGHSHEHSHDHSHNHVRNTVYGCTIFLGLMLFFSVDKFMRLLGGGHSHAHDHGHKTAKLSGSSSASESESKPRIRKRRGPKAKRFTHDASEADDEKDTGELSVSTREAKKPIKHSAYLNLIADAAHNFTDGLAMSASFYLSHAAGLSTFVAVFFHEIPHELGDFAILVQSGFSRTSALASQFFTALGAIAGTIVGILIEETSRGNSLNIRGLFTSNVPVFAPATEAGGRSMLSFVFGSIFGLLPSTVAGVPWSKLVIPFTAGGFIYVGTVSVLPDLLQPDEEEHEHSKSRMARYLEKQKVKRGITMALVELGAMLVGLGIMAVIALGEE
ncbi:hypothetical protein J3B01_003141 [Coemansia erecta]|nr:hypothetical protein J3B01_003141 [Coemansia erecta]